MCGRYLFFDQNNARIRSLLALLERQLGDEPLSELSLGEVFSIAADAGLPVV